MKKTVLTILCVLSAGLLSAQYIYPFQNTTLSDDERLDNLLSLMTIDEKINALSVNLGVTRLGIRSPAHSDTL